MVTTVMLLVSVAQQSENFRRVEEGLSMRSHYGLTIIALVLIGFGVKLFFFPAPSAEANTKIGRNVGIDVSEMHKNLNLSEQKLHDMTFVFSDGD